MVFSSYEFLFFFLPIVIAVTNIYKNRTNYFNAALTFFSLCFYIKGEGGYVFILIISSVIDYIIGQKIERTKIQKEKKRFLKISVISNITILIIFKYADFLITQVNLFLKLTGFSKSFPMMDISLPLGISFFTFQSMSYSIDVYREEVKSSKSFCNFLMYVSMFPQLVAGPIIRYKDIEHQIGNKKFKIYSGIERFIIGLAKKVIIADTVSFYADIFFNADPLNLNIVSAWVGILAYTIQIYFDFSGYSDMAIGLGRMFGFNFPENFNYPYSARSIQDFWRRWHISLSTWFRDYLYIPLGGNKKGKTRTYLNQILVFLLCGLWHGASYNFVIWGLFHGFWLSIEKLLANRLPFLKYKLLAHFYTLILVMIGWVFFRASDLNAAIEYLLMLINTDSFNVNSLFNVPIEFYTVCLISLPMVTTHPYQLYQKLDLRIKNIVLLVLFIITIAMLSVTKFSPFIYFRF